MRSRLGQWDRIWAVALASYLPLIIYEKQFAPIAVAAGLAGALPFWRIAWRSAVGTSLRGALIWAVLAIGLGILSQLFAISEPLDAGRPWTARVTYMMTLAILAALISVLGARNPGSGAWTVLMVLLVVVFLIPWLEISGRVRRGQDSGFVRLDSPWNLFYGLLVIAGVTNYLPTKYGAAAAVLGAGLAGEYLGLSHPNWTPELRSRTWELVAWSLGLCLWLVRWQVARMRWAGHPLDRLWLWFRDHWGVVWALRTSERFNRTAEQARWPFRLSWFGHVPADASETGEADAAMNQAVTTLRLLLRRFVTPDRVESLFEASPSGPCQARGTSE